MSGEALAPVPENPLTPRRRGLPIVGAVFALAVSAGLIWWLAAPQAPDTPAPAAAIRPHPAAPAPRAPLNADPAQVQRAFEAVQDAYADGGADGLARADGDCAAALKTDARVLDYCLAFDLFATAVAPEIARNDPEAARIEAARTALPPGADPAQRVAAVRALTRQASLGGEAPPAVVPRAPPGPPVRIAAAKPAAPHATRAKQRRLAARAAVRALFAKAQADGCAARPTLAERLVCGDARLSASDHRMRQAYEAALSAGADPLLVDAGQARFHAARDAAKDAAAVEKLYEQRTRELEDLSPPH